MIGLYYSVYALKSMGDTKFTAIFIVYIISAIFISYFLYYLTVFLVGTSVGNWYFQNDRSVFYGYCTAFYNVGSFCFCSIVITVIMVLRIFASTKTDS